MKSRGVTLLELMMTLVVLAILASIAFPSFQAHVVKSRRAEALGQLLSVQLKQEEYCVTNVSPTTNLSLVGGDPTDYYSYSVTVSSALPCAYTLTATATTGKSQVNDTGCTVLTLDSQGIKTPVDCWK